MPSPAGKRRKIVAQKGFTYGSVGRRRIVLPSTPEAPGAIRELRGGTFIRGETRLFITGKKQRRAVLTMPVSGRKVVFVCVQKRAVGAVRTVIMKEIPASQGKGTLTEPTVEELRLLRQFKPVLVKLTWPKGF